MYEETIQSIEWDDLENAYLSDLGHTWKKYEDIPEEYRHLVKPPKHVPKNFKANKRPTTKLFKE